MTISKLKAKYQRTIAKHGLETCLECWAWVEAGNGSRTFDDTLATNTKDAMCDAGRAFMEELKK